MVKLAKGNVIPRVLIGAPVSDRHAHLLDEWINHLNSLTYNFFDVCLIDTTLDKKDYYERIKKLKVKGKKIKAMRHTWDPDKWHPIQMLAHAREKIREHFLKGNYDFLFWLDDDIFIPKNGIQRLLSYDKDCAGFYVHVFQKPIRKPCVLKSGEIVLGKGLEYFTFAEIAAYKEFARKYKEGTLTKQEKLLVPYIIKDKWKPHLFKTYGVGLGCLMIKKKVMEAVPFRTHPTFIYGEDLWFFAEANDKNFECWCDSTVRAIHKNTEWESVVSKSKKQMGFYIAQGPSDAKEAVIVDRKKKK